MEKSRIHYSILLSAAIQLTLGAFSGHPYDQRVFLAVGYSVAHGASPYAPTDVSGVFGESLFPEAVPGIGYPPPWSLMLALAYLASYNLVPNLVLYNLAIKIPIVIANILLALLVGRIVFSETSKSVLAENTTRFMLFNPYVVYTTAIWGQFDTASMLLMLLAIYVLSQGKWRSSALALGGAIALKVVPIVVLPLLVLVQRKSGGWRQAAKYSALVFGIIALSLSPFLLGWSIKPIVENWNIQFVRIGAFSPMSVLLPFGISESAGGLSALGYLWLPSLAAIYFLLYRRTIARQSHLILATLAIMVTVSLSRSWVSEQNLNFVLPLVLIASVTLGWSRKWVTATWALPLIFAFLHTCPLQMLFLVAPESLLYAVTLDQFQSNILTMMRAVTTAVWLLIGLGLLRKSLTEYEPLHRQRTRSSSASATRTAQVDSMFAPSN